MAAQRQSRTSKRSVIRATSKNTKANTPTGRRDEASAGDAELVAFGVDQHDPIRARPSGDPSRRAGRTARIASRITPGFRYNGRTPPAGQCRPAVARVRATVPALTADHEDDT